VKGSKVEITYCIYVSTSNIVVSSYIRYDIYLLQLGFYLVAVVLTLVHKRKKKQNYMYEKQYR